MIMGFRHKGLQGLFETGSTRGFNPQWKKRLQIRLEVLDGAQSLDDIDIPGWRLHELKGERAGTWAIEVTANYRMTFRIESGKGEFDEGGAGETERGESDSAFDVCDVDLEDYH